MASSTSILQYCKLTTENTNVDAQGAVTVAGTRDYFFLSSDVYTGEIGKRLGITIIPFDKWEGSEPLIPVSALLLAGKLVRLRAEVAGTDKINYYNILCDRQKVGDIMGNVSSKNLHDQDFKVRNNSRGKVIKVRSATRDSFR
jgi:hypothetical protein